MKIRGNVTIHRLKRVIRFKPDIYDKYKVFASKEVKGRYDIMYEETPNKYLLVFRGSSRECYAYLEGMDEYNKLEERLKQQVKMIWSPK